MKCVKVFQLKWVTRKCIDIHWGQFEPVLGIMSQFRKRMSVILVEKYTELALAAKAKCIMRNGLVLE